MSKITWLYDDGFLIDGVKINENNEIKKLSSDDRLFKKIQESYKNWLNGEKYYFSRILCPLSKRYNYISKLKNKNIPLEKYIDVLKALEWAEDRITELLNKNTKNQAQA